MAAASNRLAADREAERKAEERMMTRRGTRGRGAQEVEYGPPHPMDGPPEIGAPSRWKGKSSAEYMKYLEQKGL